MLKRTTKVVGGSAREVGGEGSDLVDGPLRGGASLGESDGDNFQDYLSLLADWLLKRASVP